MKITEFYQKVYNDLIQKRKNNPIFKKDQYCECHHIIPKCMGGTDNKENLVNLTPREHFIAHLLLARIYRDTIYYSSCLSAVIYMIAASHRYKQRSFSFNSKAYERIRIEYSNSRKNYFEKLSKEKQQEISTAISNGLRGRKLSEEHKRNIGLGGKGKKKPESFRINATKRLKEYNELQRKPVLCITTGKIYSSVNDAEKDTNACVARVCMGKYHSSGGLQFRYLDDELNNQYTPKRLRINLNGGGHK